MLANTTKRRGLWALLTMLGYFAAAAANSTTCTDCTVTPAAITLLALAALFIVVEISLWVRALANSRPCPRCGHRVPNGRLECEDCGYRYG